MKETVGDWVSSIADATGFPDPIGHSHHHDTDKSKGGDDQDSSNDTNTY